MRPRRQVTMRNYAEDEESCSSVDNFRKNIHEMETQRIDSDDDSDFDLDDDDTPRSKRLTRSCRASTRTPKQATPSGRATRNSLKSTNTPTTIAARSSPRLTPRATPKSAKKTNSVSTPKLGQRNKAVTTPTITPKRRVIPSRRKPSEEEDSNDPKNAEQEPDLTGFMATLNASPSTSPGNQKDTTTTSRNASKVKVIDAVPKPSDEPEFSNSKPSSDVDCQTERPKEASDEASASTSNAGEQEVVEGKLRSSVADSIGHELARRYRKSLRETEEYALNYISAEFHHPAISCFREITKMSDIRSIVGNSKLKKSCNTLEQSVVYLGLIDLLATTTNNPLYSQSDPKSKIFLNVSSSVKKILLEMKNMLGSWALSGNEQLSGRYTLIINYLRLVVPMFRRTGFDTELATIIDCIEQEVNRHKQNQEKIRSMNGNPRGSENLDPKQASSAELPEVDRSALNEIVLNVDLNVKLDDSDDDEEINVVKNVSETSAIFGKPLKPSPGPRDLVKKKIKKAKSSLGFFKSTVNSSPQPSKLSLATKKTPLPKEQSLPSANSSSSVGKRTATDELQEVAKKRKLEEGTPGTSISSFFKPANSAGISTPKSTGPPKPTVNAFALMMNKSKEIAQKKKLTQAAATVPTVKVDAVKA